MEMVAISSQENYMWWNEVIVGPKSIDALAVTPQAYTVKTARPHQIEIVDEHERLAVAARRAERVPAHALQPRHQHARQLGGGRARAEARVHAKRAPRQPARLLARGFCRVISGAFIGASCR
eukprot:6206171-Pleurochrysis_carterae.AAC.4